MLLRRRGVREEGNDEGGKRVDGGTLKCERRLNTGGQAGKERKAVREREKERMRICVRM